MIWKSDSLQSRERESILPVNDSVKIQQPIERCQNVNLKKDTESINEIF